MNTDLTLVEITQLRQILRDISRSRSQLQDNLDLLQAQLEADSGMEPERVGGPAGSQSELELLQSECEELKQRLARVRSERDRARREARSVRDRVADAVGKSTHEIYRAISRQDPFSQLDRLRQEKRDADKRSESLNDENRKLQQKVADLETQVESLDGLAGRYKDEITSHEGQLEDARTEARRTALKELIQQVTARRLAELMDIVEDPARSVTADQETVKVLEWLVKYLQNSGVRIMYRQGECIVLQDKDLHAFRLDEEYREGGVCQVISPGFLLGQDVLIRAKVRYVEEDDNGIEQLGHNSDSEEVPGSGRAS